METVPKSLFGFVVAIQREIREGMMYSENGSNDSPDGYPSGNWQSWEIMIVVLMLIGLAMMTCGGPALVIFF